MFNQGRLWLPSIESSSVQTVIMKSTITDDYFSEMVAQSLSVAQVIVRLGLVPAGGNYKTVQARIKKLDLGTSHFTGNAWNVGEQYRDFGRQYRLTDILVVKLSVCLHARFAEPINKRGVQRASL